MLIFTCWNNNAFLRIGWFGICRSLNWVVCVLNQWRRSTWERAWTAIVGGNWYIRSTSCTRRRITWSCCSLIGVGRSRNERRGSQTACCFEIFTELKRRRHTGRGWPGTTLQFIGRWERTSGRWGRHTRYRVIFHLSFIESRRRGIIRIGMMCLMWKLCRCSGRVLLVLILLIICCIRWPESWRVHTVI